MPGRKVSIPVVARESRDSRRVLASVLAVVALLAFGIAIGSRIAAPRESSTRLVDATSLPGTSRTPNPPARAALMPTRAGAVTAAARSINAFDGDILLEPVRLRAVVGRIASAASRARLVEAFDQASAQTRAKL